MANKVFNPTNYPAPSALHASDQIPIHSGADTDLAYVQRNNLTDHGALYEDAGSPGTVITITTAGTFYGWKSATAGPLRGITADVADATADHLTVARTANYLVTMFVSFSGSNNAVAEGSIFVDGVESTVKFYRKLGTGGDVGTATAQGILALTAAEEVSLRFTSDGNGDTINVWAACLTLTEIL
jgi:hypothetical protein